MEINSQSLPVLTAIATLIAAFVAAVTAITVALVNARYGRRLERDKAHRAYRQAIVGSGAVLLAQPGWAHREPAECDSCHAN